MIKRSLPHMKIEVRLVPYGYQLDIFDYTLATIDGQGVRHRMECHDWSANKSVCRRAEQVSEAVIKAVHDID